jgi:genome maintenance exonuclease 1
MNKTFTHTPREFPKLLQENINGTRMYLTPDGSKYPSVTTVLSDYNKEGILQWRKNVGEEKANEISKKATTRGTRVHKIIEKYLLNEEIQGLDEMMPDSKSIFFKMKSELNNIDNIFCLETRLFSHELKLAGTVDCIAEYKGELSVIDFKTANRLKKKADIENYFMQVSAYAKMFSEHTGLAVNNLVIMIGVDSAPFPQIMKARGLEILSYGEKMLQFREQFYLREGY